MIRFNNIGKNYPIKKSFLGKPLESIQALHGVSLDIPLGVTTGIVGESGSGKTTLARVFTGLVQPDSGHFTYNGFDSRSMTKENWREFRREVQLVFQDPYGSLNPRLTIRKILEEPVEIHKKRLALSAQEIESRLQEVIGWVGLGADSLNKYPHEFSGGQRQRIGIARTLMLMPKLLVLDEPVSALDVSIQAQILNLLLDLKNKLGLTFLFIAHDLGVVHYMAEYTAVMYKGHLVEMGETDKLFARPKHPYTKMLLDSVPDIGKPLPQGAFQAAADSVSFTGCPYTTRCERAIDECSINFPEKRANGKTGFYWCHAPLK